MEHDVSKRNLRKNLVIGVICFLFICVCVTPAIEASPFDYHTRSHSKKISTLASNGDIPTWVQGDQWLYTVNPLSFSSPNGSFSGSIENFKQKVIGIIDGTYTINITGQISGDITVNSFSGDLTGQISGTSQIRISDLAEQTTELHSVGTIIYLFVPFPYEMNLFMNSTPALETYDFPLQVDEQWYLDSITTIEGSFSIQGLYEQSFNQSQSVNETIQCTQQQQINVPAGTFECYKIGRQTTQSWYSADVGNIVKSTVDQTGQNTTLQAVITLQSYSLSTQLLTLTEDISPSVVAPNVSISISGKVMSTSSGDPIQNGIVSLEIPSTGASWSTTTNSMGYYSKTIVAPMLSDDTPSGRETGSGGIIVRCSSGSLSGYRVRTLATMLDNSPAAPFIEGPTEGKPRVSYPYTVVSTDPDGDDVFYYIDWGDTTNSSWLGPYPSNQNLTLNHTFTKKGSYIIKVQARDTYYALSSWGSLQVKMPTASSSTFVWKIFHRFPLIFSLLQHLKGD